MRFVLRFSPGGVPAAYNGGGAIRLVRKDLTPSRKAAKKEKACIANCGHRIAPKGRDHETSQPRDFISDHHILLRAIRFDGMRLVKRCEPLPRRSGMVAIQIILTGECLARQTTFPGRVANSTHPDSRRRIGFPSASAKRSHEAGHECGSAQQKESAYADS